MKSTLKSLVLCLGFLTSAQSFALVSVYGLVGKSMGKLSSENTSVNLDGISIAAGVHFDPIPLVPVSAGVRLKRTEFGSNSDIKEANLLEFTPEVRAWLPVGDLRPYVKLGYTVFGQATGTFKGSPYNSNFTAEERTPVERAAGLEYAILPLIGLLLEYEHATAEWKFSKYEVNGRDVKDSAETSKSRLQTISLGVTVGL